MKVGGACYSREGGNTDNEEFAQSISRELKGEQQSTELWGLFLDGLEDNTTTKQEFLLLFLFFSLCLRPAAESLPQASLDLYKS